VSVWGGLLSWLARAVVENGKVSNLQSRKSWWALVRNLSEDKDIYASGTST